MHRTIRQYPATKLSNTWGAGRFPSYRGGVLAIRLLVVLSILGSSVMLPRLVEAGGPPEVNGLFYGDGDYQKYTEISTSEYGSKLYIYFDNPTVYVALVVDRSVNDNVFAGKQAESEYMADAGWSGRHDAAQLTNSEYAEFTLRCAVDPLAWTWQQGYARFENTLWVSDEEGSGSGTPPLSYKSASSFAWNMNTWNAASTKLWDMQVNGTGIKDWKSPFDPTNPDAVVGLEGYPATGPLTFSHQYQYEWPMVYEWSVNLRSAGCGSSPVYFVAGSSHHSPLKSDGNDENDNFPTLPVDEQEPFFDFGDLPDSYDTTRAVSGAAHIITLDGAHLGSAPDMEPDGLPAFGAAADDATAAGDEDGLARQNTNSWQPGDTVGITFDVQGVEPTADIGLWMDWNRDGDFADAGEYYAFLDRPTGVVSTESLVVPAAYAKGAPLNVRVRVFNDVADAPGGSLDAADYAGLATTGEVEDYTWGFSPTAVTLARDLNGRGLGFPSAVGLVLLALACLASLTPLLKVRRQLV